MAYAIDTADNLAPSETAVSLDTGELVAVSVSRTRLENGAGIAFVAKARVIDAGGSTVTDAVGAGIVSEASHTADPGQIGAMGADAIAADVLKAVLGETTTIGWSDEFKANASIRSAIAYAASAGSPDAAALLA